MNGLAVTPHITHDLGNNVVIHQRKEDGYVNATQLCRAGKKLFGDWRRLKETNAFLEVLSGSMGICIDQIVQIMSTGSNDNRGTWVHPQVAVNLGQWLSPQFAVKVSQWVWQWMQQAAQGDTSFNPLVAQHEWDQMRFLNKDANIDLSKVLRDQGCTPGDHSLAHGTMNKALVGKKQKQLKKEGLMKKSHYTVDYLLKKQLELLNSSKVRAATLIKRDGWQVYKTVHMPGLCEELHEFAKVWGCYGWYGESVKQLKTAAKLERDRLLIEQKKKEQGQMSITYYFTGDYNTVNQAV
jgi:hypothetical protein